MTDDRREEPRAEAEAAPVFLLNVNVVFVASILVNLLGFFVVVVIARALGPDGRGLTALYQNVVGIAFALLSFGASLAAIYFVGRREMSARDAMEASLTLTLFAAIVCLVGTAIAQVLWPDALSESGLPYWLVVVAVPAAIQGRQVEGVLRAEGRFVALGIVQLVFPVATLIALLVLDLMGELTAARAVTVWTLTAVVQVAVGYVYLGPATWPRRLALGEVLRKTVKLGFEGQSGNLIQLLNYRLDSYLILIFLSTSAVGLYSLAVSLSEGLWFFANSVSVVLMTRLTTSDATYAARTTPVVCRNTLLVTALGAVTIGLVAPIVVPAVFGKAFDDAVTPLLWLLPGTVALAGTKVLAAYIFSVGRVLINTWIAAGSLVVTVAADFVLIPWLGIDGAAIASSLAYGLSLILTAIAYRRLSGQPARDALIPRLSDVAIYTASLRGLLARLRPSEGLSAPQ